MAALKKMPVIQLDSATLAEWGQVWLGTDGSDVKVKSPNRPKGKKAITAAQAAANVEDMQSAQAPAKTKKKAYRFDRKQSMDFGLLFDQAFGKAVVAMLGNNVEEVNSDALQAPKADCMEVGKTRIVGGIRPQNYDAAYGPDGPRIVYDSKTLNERKSVGKNWQNMIDCIS